jgi:hypothetical protein
MKEYLKFYTRLVYLHLSHITAENDFDKLYWFSVA